MQGKKQFSVRLTNGVIKSFQCDLMAIKKKISQEIFVQFDRIVLVDQEFNKVYSPSFYLQNNDIQEITLQVLNLDELLQENLQQKKESVRLEKKLSTLESKLKKAKEDYEFTIKLQRDQLISQQQEKISQLDEELKSRDLEKKELQEKIKEFDNEIFSQSQENQKLKNEISSLQQNAQIYEQQLQQTYYQYNQQLQYYEQEFNKLQLSKDEIESKAKKQKQTSKKEIEDLENQLNQIQQDKNNEIENLKFQIDQKNDEINQSNKLLEQMKQQFKNISNQRKIQLQEDYQLQLNMKEQQFYQEKLVNKNIHNVELKQKQEEIIKLKTEKDSLQQQMINLKKKYEKEIENLEKDIENWNKKFLQKNQEIDSIKNKFEQEKQQIANRMNAEIQNIEKQKDQEYQQKEKFRLQVNQAADEKKLMMMEAQQLRNKLQQLKDSLINKERLLQSKSSLIKKMSSQFKKKPLNEVTNAYEKLYKLDFRNQIINGTNTQWDDTTYKIYSINPTHKILKKINEFNLHNIEAGDFKIENLGEVTLQRSLQPNADGDYYKLYFLKLFDQSVGIIRGYKYLIRKWVKSQTEKSYSRLEDAAMVSVHQLITDVLLQKFNEILGVAKIQQLKIGVAPQYVIQAGNEFYNCEVITDQPIKKINGGEFMLKNDQIDQYLNSFSKFIYQYSQKYCIVSNMYANKDFIYEMIVSTADGGFHELDYGEREIKNTLANIVNQPTCLGRFYNEQVENLASTN